MGRTTPLAKDEGLESILEPGQAQKPSREDVEAVFVRLQALRAQLVKEKVMRTSDDVPSVAYKQILDLLKDSERAADSFKGLIHENYTDVAADYLRTLGEATQQHTQELYQDMPKEATEGRRYSQLQLDLNARLLREINEFI